MVFPSAPSGVDVCHLVHGAVEMRAVSSIQNTAQGNTSTSLSLMSWLFRSEPMSTSLQQEFIERRPIDGRPNLDIRSDSCFGWMSELQKVSSDALRCTSGKNVAEGFLVLGSAASAALESPSSCVASAVTTLCVSQAVSVRRVLFDSRSPHASSTDFASKAGGVGGTAGATCSQVGIAGLSD